MQSSSKTPVIVAVITAIGSIIAAIIGGYYLLQNTALEKTIDLTMTALVVENLKATSTPDILNNTATVPNTSTPYPTYTPLPTYTVEPTIEIIESSPTTIPTVLVVATPLPLGALTLGIFNRDGSIIDKGQVEIHPRVKMDALGNLQGDRDIYEWANIDSTGLVKFTGLEPNTYIICLGYAGSWVKGGEIVVEPNKEIRQDITWPRYEMGGSCDLK